MKIINVTNRLPVSIERGDNGLELKQSSGGLVSALASMKNEEADLVWVGMADFKMQDWNNVKNEYKGEFAMYPVFGSEKEYKQYYNGFSNSVLWPLFHYFPSFVEFEGKDFESYQNINQKIADKVIPLIGKEDIVWIHDYHLLLLPALIRMAKPDAKIGFFLHIPFPSYELIRILPKKTRNLLLEGMLGADIIGFHTFDYCKHFLETIQTEKGIIHHFFNVLYQERTIEIKAFPISIDYDKFNSAIAQKTVKLESNKIKQLYKDKKIIFSVDRLDYSKGILYRLKGFQRFLELHPLWHEKVVFILVLIPSRTDVNKYSERKQMIDSLVSHINGRLGNFKWTPIVYQFHSLNFNELVGLYTGCDIALISPIRDGMNLVAKEFIASRQDEKGVLMLSEMTGAAKELSEAVLFNPLDENEIADKLNLALNMSSEEQKNRIKPMQTRIKKFDISHWTTSFINSLISNKRKSQTVQFDANLHVEISNEFQNAKKRLILLDYDGTLAAFSNVPEDAIPTSEVLDLLELLSSNSKNTVAIVSGRDKEILEAWFGNKRLKIIAEHGAFIKDLSWKVTIKEDILWKKPVKDLFKQFTQSCEGSFVEEKEYSIAWHYRMSEKQTGYNKSRELLETLQYLILNSGAKILDGNKVVEVKSAFVNKGIAITNLFDLSDFDFCLAIGDDKTDEDMFKVVNKKSDFTFKVGNENTNANYRFINQQQVISFLHRLSYSK